jgi:hypothetical protein
MRSFLGLAAFGGCVGAIALWDLAVVAALRSFGIKLLFSTPFHFYTRRERELLAALNGRPKDTYVLISGFLFFACPLFAGLTTFDYIIRRYIDHSTIGLDYVVGSAVVFVMFVMFGVGISNRKWKKFAGMG